MKQTEKILDYLRKYGSITPLDAMREFSCMRLASRIADLKKQGYSIERVIEKSTNYYGEIVHYARYTLHE